MILTLPLKKPTPNSYVTCFTVVDHNGMAELHRAQLPLVTMETMQCKRYFVSTGIVG